LKHLVILTTFIALAPSWLLAAQFEDALGRQLVFDRPPQRIISLVPAVTEILFKLDLQDRVVAVTDYCNYPEAAKKLPKVGQYSRPSLESILLYKPDLVIASASMNRRSLIKRLETLHIQVYVVNPHNVTETMQTMTTIGAISGHQKEAKTAVADIQAKLSRLENQLEQTQKPRVLTFIMLQPLTVAGPETFIDDIISRGGGKNIVPPGPSRYPTWNSEALLAFDPEVIIVSAHPGQPAPQNIFQQWPQLQAVKNNRIFQINADLLHRPGPRMTLGIEAMAKALHPDIGFDD